MLVGGTPALEQDSIHSLFDKAPLMLVVLLTTTMLLMFLAFGSVVLPIKAAVMSALTLGSTMGILTWIFVDGHFSKLLNFTPTPLMVVAHRVGHRGRFRPGHRLRGLPGVADGGGPSTRHVHRGSHPDRNGDHRSPHHRRRVGPRRGRRVVRVLRPGDDEVPRVRPDGSTAVGRHRRPDVPGAVGDEAARRRLLVGAAVDEAPAEPDGARRDSPARRAQEACPPRPRRAPGGRRTSPCRRHAQPRPPHDPTHPGTEAPPRPSRPLGPRLGRSPGRRLRTRPRPPAPRRCRRRSS